MNAINVSICGGGLGGLTLALVIGKYGTLPVEIFEARPTITAIGAGISFFKRTMDIMKDLGLYDEIVKMAIGPPQENIGPIFRKSDQRDGHHWFSRKVKGGQLTVHRKDMLECLFQHVLPYCAIHTSKKLISYNVNSTTRKIMLYFSDGSSSITDVLVGADGIHSATRRTMFQGLASSIPFGKGLLDCIDPVWTGVLVYRSLVPTMKLLKKYPDVKPPTSLTMYVGKNKHIVAYPISQGRQFNVAILCQNRDFGTPFEGPWATDVSEEEIAHSFEDWEVRAEALVKCIERPSRWALHCLNPLPCYVDGRVALLGDSAHAMEPHLGAGAGQAIEDAYVLGRLLTHELTNLGNIDDALKTYEEVRLPFANGIMDQSRKVGQYYSLSVPEEDTAPTPGSPEELVYLRKSIEDAWEWQNESECVWDEAERRWRLKCNTLAKL